MAFRQFAIVTALLCLLPVPARTAEPVPVLAAEPVCVSGIYPHLAMFNDEGECGTGAVVPWADRLWVITYGPHLPFGSSDRLYEVAPDLTRTVRPESVGGTHANRMIHVESQQLFIGPYVIDAARQVRVIPPSRMPGRHTGTARHLIEPGGKVYYATMEEGLYEVDVQSLAVTSLIRDGNAAPRGFKVETPLTMLTSKLPGYHGKGLFTGQGRLIYANNGDHAAQALRDPETPSGALAEWDTAGEDWRLVRRNQFTEVTGPGGLQGNASADDPVWSMGWDHRSLILMCLDAQGWRSYRLPKASHSYDGAHGWNTEWPRIRDVGEDDLLMTMHGTFWRFPRRLSNAHSAGIAPRSTYLKVIGDFARWGEHIVCGCDDTAKSEFLNKRKAKGNVEGPGRSQSNLWFLAPQRLDELGPARGQGAVWLNDDVQSDAPSDPFLFSGYDTRALHLAHRSQTPVRFQIEIDKAGQGQWQPGQVVTVPPDSCVRVEFGPQDQGAWVRIRAEQPARQVVAQFHFRNIDRRPQADPAVPSAFTAADSQTGQGGLLHVRGADFKTLRYVARDAGGEIGCYDLNESLQLQPANDPQGAEWVKQKLAIPLGVLTSDGTALIYEDATGRWRLPVGSPQLIGPGPLGPARVCREVCTERDLLNAGGTFFELPAENAGGISRIRPVCTHNRRIHDFATWRGLLAVAGVDLPVLAGADSRASVGGHPGRVVRSDDGRAALWVGTVDDLWQLGRPHGICTAWNDVPVTAGTPSDPCLVNGYDGVRLEIRHDSREPLPVRVEADLTGAGDWWTVATFTAKPGLSETYTFPDSFHAYWGRVVVDRGCRVTAQFELSR